jgi:hypothetical protein
MHDLLKRVVFQERIRDLVLKFRSGIVYHESFLDFIQQVDSCAASSYDAPNFMYMQDEGTILRKIMEAFCMRPLKIVSAPTHGAMVTNFTSRGKLPWGMQPIVERGSVAVELPNPMFRNSTIAPKIDLLTCFKSSQIISMGGLLQQRQTNLMYTEGTFIFYVNRRIPPVHFSTRNRMQARFVIPQPAGIELMNKYPIDFNDELNRGDFNGKTYTIRSVVCCSTIPQMKDTAEADMERILGCHTIFVIDRYADKGEGLMDNEKRTYWKYDPAGALSQLGHPHFKLASTDGASTDGSAFLNMERSVFLERGSEYGTIFIYDLMK